VLKTVYVDATNTTGGGRIAGQSFNTVEEGTNAARR
jgi:hypothetical protein